MVYSRSVLKAQCCDCYLFRAICSGTAAPTSEGTSGAPPVPLGVPAPGVPVTGANGAKTLMPESSILSLKTRRSLIRITVTMSTLWKNIFTITINHHHHHGEEEFEVEVKEHRGHRHPHAHGEEIEVEVKEGRRHPTILMAKRRSKLNSRKVTVIIITTHTVRRRLKLNSRKVVVTVTNHHNPHGEEEIEIELKEAHRHHHHHHHHHPHGEEEIEIELGEGRRHRHGEDEVKIEIEEVPHRHHHGHQCTTNMNLRSWK
ncbi:hypothetical protein DFJ43DRAFT_1214858 [Lentinula guzmanii]|uniref:Uncharacterized protein n=1 Tax=Lentinula guzmanii TaxID=2804957 RepID=A0AA38N2Z8_9AGAR|nr:hypothetical protein DFJ43DRAFT_1214858 [Lentinula guzmanii]